MLQAQALPLGVIAFPFPKRTDTTTAGWQIENRPNNNSTPANPPTLRVDPTNDDRVSLALDATFPGTVGLARSIDDDQSAWGTGRLFRTQIKVSTSAPNTPVSTQLAVWHKQWGWFVSRLSRPLKTGEWNDMRWLLSEAESADWQSLDGSVEWNDSIRFRLSRMALRFHCDAPGKRTIHIMQPTIQGVDATPPALQVIQLRDDQNSFLQGKRYELSFDLSRAYNNPFDPDQVVVDVDYVTPSGKRHSIPGFYYQDYIRSRLSDGTEECDASGRASWKARFLPREAGLHQYAIRVSDHMGDECRTSTKTFTIQTAPFSGFVRIDPKDPSYMSLEDDSFFYPHGLVVRCPYDTRCTYHYEFEPQPGQGTFIYENVMPHMADAGMNFIRIWMSSWWLALEWSDGFRTDYEGLGRYSQLSAWRLDRIMEMAEDLGIYVNLTLQNHGQFTFHRTDPEWYHNPYNIARGGTLRQPNEFWKDEFSRKMIKKRLRYTVARWAYSPALAWWEIFNEINLVQSYKTKEQQEWHAEMARYIRQADPFNHIITTHYTSSGYDKEMFKIKEMEVVQSNGYNYDMIKSCKSLLKRFRDSAEGKPYYINEFGVGNTRDYHRHNLHAGLWASSVLPFSGSALFWYFQYVEGQNDYGQFTAVQQFHENEDYRERGFIETEEVIVSAGTTLTECLGMRNDEALRLWIYDKSLYRGGMRQFRKDAFESTTIANVNLTIPEMPRARYHIEFWDTWEGGLIPEQNLEIDHEGGGMLFNVPTFERDIACKIERMGDMPPLPVDDTPTTQGVTTK